MSFVFSLAVTNICLFFAAVTSRNIPIDAYLTLLSCFSFRQMENGMYLRMAILDALLSQEKNDDAGNKRRR